MMVTQAFAARLKKKIDLQGIQKFKDKEMKDNGVEGNSSSIGLPLRSNNVSVS